MNKSLIRLVLGVLTLTLFAFALAACGGGGGGAVANPPVQPPPVTNESPGGIWFGTDSDGDEVLALVTETGRFHFVDEFLSQGSGILSVSNGNDVTGNFQLVPQLGFTFPDGTTSADCTLSGTVAERQTVAVTVNCTTTAGLQDQITATLSYEALYDRDSSLATIAGIYGDGSGIVTDIAADGAIFEQDPVSGCVTNGQVSIIDSAFNAYDVEFGFSNCTGQFVNINGSSFVGIATLDNTVTPEVLFIAATGDVAGTFVSFVSAVERLSSGWTPGVFLDYSTFFAMCAAPRSGINPATGQPFPDIQGTTVDENNFLRSYSNDTYLWYDEITDRDPALFTTPEYFDLLKTNATTASGQPKDKFHSTIPSDEWFELSQSGVSAGYGAEWVALSGVLPGEVVVAFTEPNSPATAVSLARGAEVLFADGVELINLNTQAAFDTVIAALFPSQAGELHDFIVRDLGAAVTRDISMTSANVTSTPVQDVGTIPTATGDVGYMLFNGHIATAETGLIDAVNQLVGVTDLIIDLRYNGGGFLDIASEFAYMIAGNGPTAGQTFEILRFNDKHPVTDPVTGQAIAPLPFHTTTQGFSVAAGQALPALNLSRVFVLSGPNTCSASEAIMNSLRGVNVEVLQIGSTTCGKPYGFYPTDNCGTTYFTIQFKGENNQGFGDYSDGFSPANTAGTVGTVVPGCSVADDFTHALGDPAESRLSAALTYRNNQTCPAPSGLAPPGVFKTSAGTDLSAIDGYVPKSPWHQNRILRR